MKKFIAVLLVLFTLTHSLFTALPAQAQLMAETGKEVGQRREIQGEVKRGTEPMQAKQISQTVRAAPALEQAVAISPQITSTPVTAVVENQPYSYDVEASGDPAPAFVLDHAPYGMSIDPASGLITWSPEVAGTFDVIVEANNSAGTDLQSFAVVVEPVGGYVWPEAQWQTANPAELGMDESKLVQARDYALTGGGAGFITRHGRLVMSWGDPNAVYDLKSTTKSIGATALGLALKDGRMALEDKAQQHHPTFGIPPDSNAATGWLDEITLRQLATQTAGFDKPGGYIDLLFQPGTMWAYSDGGPNWLAEAITLAFGEDLNSLMFRRVFTPLGITGSDLTWRSNWYRNDTINGIKNREFGAGISADVNAMARLGYLYLRRGAWKDQQILPVDFIDQARTAVPGVIGLPVRNPSEDCGASNHYGLLWWNNADSAMPKVPPDTFFSWGLYESLIVVYPSLDIVVARAGDSWHTGLDSCYDVLAPFLEPIAQSVLDLGPQNQPPVVALTAPADGAQYQEGQAIGIEATASDGDGSVVKVGFYADGVLLGEAATAPYRYTWNGAKVGGHSLTAKATDDGGASALSGAVSVTVEAQEAPATRLWLAANTGALAGAMAQSTEYAAGSLVGELVYPNTTAWNTQNTTQADSASYSVSLPTAGTWYLWARLYYPGTTAQPVNDPNSFWAAVDGGPAKVLGNRTGVDRTWHWDNAQGQALSLGTLAAGSHTLKIWNREARESAAGKLSPRLDVLLLTSEAGYVPNDDDARAGLSESNTGDYRGAPYPPSPVITALSWAPAAEITRAAPGSDNWPVTWGDDDQLYTAYGDGWGFEPKVETKLSLGFAQVAGPPDSFTGANLRSTGEQLGDAESGIKASGLLMVNGVLYLWARNADHNGQQCQLAWSSDHAQTWTWADWTFAEFGYCTFINFGRDYAGARDGYVYTVTHDHPSAYHFADRFILMRVPQDQIGQRDAYEFFQGLDGGGGPQWTADIQQRGAVFTHPGQARRSGISYNPVLKRYLWWQGLNQPAGWATPGGFGVYDAPEPWGPWTTVFYTQGWDVDPGETGSFPTKWISADGKSLYLVFSGGDSFSVRQATLTVKE